MNRLQTRVRANGDRTLLGAALYFYDPIFLEIAAHLGYQAIWIEMEHAHITFAEAADLCRMAAGSGMLTMIRIPDTRRENVLKAAECGPDMIDVPMINTPQQIHELIKYSRFAPVGERGFFSVSRAVKYGLVDNVPDEQQQLNSDLCLMAQIETVEALDRLEEIAAVPGVDLFTGPADLAASMGFPGQPSHPKVMAAARRIIKTARQHGKTVSSACGRGDMAQWLELGLDLLFITNDITCLKSAAQATLREAKTLLGETETRVETAG
ncbi:MAG: aldolase/citrate lyase family protein [Acidobacteriaceae bacterium]